MKWHRYAQAADAVNSTATDARSEMKRTRAVVDAVGADIATAARTADRTFQMQQAAAAGVSKQANDALKRAQFAADIWALAGAVLIAYLALRIARGGAQ